MNNLNKLINEYGMAKQACDKSLVKQASLEDAMEAVNTYMNKIASTNANDLVASGITGVSAYVNYQNNSN